MQPHHIQAEDIVRPIGKLMGMYLLIINEKIRAFDGDQMSVISLNKLPSIVEASTLATIPKFAISKKMSLPDVGQTYDSIIGCFLTSRQTAAVDKNMAVRMVANCFWPEDIIPRINEMFKKRSAVLGNDVFSLILPKFNFVGNPSWYEKKYDKVHKYDPLEKKVVIEDGIIKSGVLDKKTIAIGQKTSLYHVIEHEYDARVAMDAAFNMQQICLAYTEMTGFSISIRDLMVSDEILKDIRKTKMQERLNSLWKLIDDLKTNQLLVPVGYETKDYFDEVYMKKAEMAHIDVGEYIDFEDNPMFQLIQSGSKGKKSVLFQILGTIGLQKVKGKILPNSFSYMRTMPYFPRFDISPESRGFIKNSYISGCSSPEFVFNAIDSRDNIVTRAIMTAVSGDQNRKSTKAMESLVVDNIRRVTNTEDVIQYLYGGDGFDVSRLINVNIASIYEVDDKTFKTNMYYDDSEYKILYEYKKVLEEQAVRHQQFQVITNTGSDIYKIRAPFSVEMILKYYENKKSSTPSKKDIEEMRKLIETFIDELPYIYFNEYMKQNKISIPSCYSSGVYLVRLQIRTYLCSNHLISKKIHLNQVKEILETIRSRLFRGLIQPGTPIGLISAQCVSEPMTQNTLDTTHGAAQEGGKKSGMGRIKEILGVKETSRIPDLAMIVQLKKEYIQDEEMNSKIATRLEMLKLKDIINHFAIFYETPLEVTHPHYKTQDEKLISTFRKYNPNYLPPRNLSKYNVRMVINKEMLFSKKIQLNDLIIQLRTKMPENYTVHSSENTEEIVIRCYISDDNLDKRTKGDIYATCDVLKDRFFEFTVRGLEGVIRAYKVPIGKKYYYDSNTKTVSELDNQYVIVTKGINLYDIFLVDEIDPTTIQTDDISSYLTMFGIISTRQKLVYELKDLVDDSLNPKHYELIADNMTRSGYLTSFEKTGLNKRERNNILLRLSSSHSRQVLEEATVNNMTAKVLTLSASLLTGTTPNSFGSSYPGLFIDHNHIKKIENK